MKSIKFKIKWVHIKIPELFIKTIDKTDFGTFTREYSLYGPIRRLQFKLNILRFRIHFFWCKIKPLECQGCGEGIAAYKIRDPNDKRKTFLCCRHCKEFYDYSQNYWYITYKTGKKPTFTKRLNYI